MDRITRKQTRILLYSNTMYASNVLYFYPLYLKEIYLKWLSLEFWIGSLHGIEQKMNKKKNLVKLWITKIGFYSKIEEKYATIHK